MDQSPPPPPPPKSTNIAASIHSQNSQTAPTSVTTANNDIPQTDLSADSQQPYLNSPARPRRAGSHSHSLSSSAIPSTASSRKSRYSEPDTSDVNVERTRFTPQPHTSSSTIAPSRQFSLHERRQSNRSDAIGEETLFSESIEAKDSLPDTPRSEKTSWLEDSLTALLQDPTAATRAGVSRLPSRRLSSNSVYSLASARGLTNYPNSQGSDNGVLPRSLPAFMSSAKATGQASTEASLSNVTVTTTSGSQNSNGGTGSHNLAPRDPHAQPLDLMKRNQRADSATTRIQPDRSRSRTTRRFSGSTANSSHSPSSDRGPNTREKEEGTFCVTQRLDFANDHSETSPSRRYRNMCLGRQGSK